ncbi:MAG: fibronectin type III domain-containing protein [Armatimonadota bacterium]
MHTPPLPPHLTRPLARRPLLAPVLGLLLALGAAASAQQIPTRTDAPSGDTAPLLDPLRPVTRISRDSFTLRYFTAEPCETRVQVREGELPMVAWRPADRKVDFWAGPGVRVVEGPAGKRTWHTVTVSGLKPGRRYFYRISEPAARPTPQEAKWGAAPPWRREFAVSTQAPRGRKTILHLPVKVLLMPNVINVASAHGPNGPIAAQPPKLTEEELELIRREYATTSRFFWVNSGMRLWVDYQIQVDPRWQRWGDESANADAFYRGWPVSRSYAGEDFSGPGGGDFTIVDTADPLRVGKRPVFEERPYSAQIEQAFVRRWNPGAKKWEFYNSGGGTFGVDQFPDGIPGRSQYLGGGDTAWLACHELHHNLESHGAFSLSNREDERIVFNHYEPRRRVVQPNGETAEMAWTTSSRHGEHWDGMAYWDRQLSDAQWLRMYFGYTLTVADADGDGFPDADSRLPLDEKRFGSDPKRAATDGNLGDLRKVMLSTWVPSCLQASWNKPPFQAIRPDPRNPDTDRDGLTDDVDPYPLYAWEPFIWPLRAAVDGNAEEWSGIPVGGETREGGMDVVFKQAHDESAYYGLFTLRGPWRRVYVTLDGEGHGFFSLNGVLGFEVLNGPEVQVRPVSVPGRQNAPGLKWKAARGTDGTTTVELSLPNRGEGIWFWDRAGREIGASIDVFAEDGKGYSIYEPYRAFYARMLEPHGRAPMPPGAPAELTAERAELVLRPGDPRLRLQGQGWRQDGAVLRHAGNDEAAVYVPVDATEFDLWIDFEAKQDAILGAFQPGTRRLGAGSDYIAFLGGYGNTVTRFRLFGREAGDSEALVTPGRHTLQLSRRGGNLWLLLDGNPVLWAADPQPTRKIDRLAFIGGYGGAQVLHEMRIKTGP